MAKDKQDIDKKKEKELLKIVKKINDFSIGCQANIVSILYKNPELFYSVNLTRMDFLDNIWKVYYTIGNSLIVKEKKNVLDDITVGLYLEQHSKLKIKYDEYGGWNTIQNAMEYVQVENLDGYIAELRKWNSVVLLQKRGFPVEDRLSEFCDMTAEEIYAEFETFLNDTFANIDNNVKSYNACEGINEFIDSLDKGDEVGLPFFNSPLLNDMVGGFNCNGNIYGLGANSGVGKSTTVLNLLLPTIIEENEKIVLFINEEDEKKVKRELLIWVANNIFKYDVQKKDIRNGNFTQEFKDKLKECADWLEDKKDKKNIIIIPLERYSVNVVIKLIKKYASMGVRYFVLDTLKESCDTTTDETYKSMMRDMVKLYDIVKPKGKNVGLFVTYQLGKASIKQRYYTNNEIGMAKSIVDVMSCNIMMRRPFEDEYEGGNKELKCYKIENIGKSTKQIKVPLSRDKNYMIYFIPKNRFGESDSVQIIAEYDISRNIYKDIGYCRVIQDW